MNIKHNLNMAALRILSNTQVNERDIDLAIDLVASSIQTTQQKQTIQSNRIIFIDASLNEIKATRLSHDEAKFISLRVLMSLFANGAFTVSSSIEQKWLIPFSVLLLVDSLWTALSRRLPVAEAIVLFTIAKHDAINGCNVDCIVNNASHVSDEKGAFLPINKILDAIESLEVNSIICLEEDMYYSIAEKVFIKEVS